MIVHVGILVVIFSLSGCAMTWLVFRASRCSERFSGTFTHVEKSPQLQKKLSNDFEKMWCDS